VHVSVLERVGAAGVMLALARVGAVFCTVTVLLVTTLPEVVPSFGVTRHTTVSSRSKFALVRVAVLAPIAVPFTCHA
jgi:hypothetical protein